MSVTKNHHFLFAGAERWRREARRLLGHAGLGQFWPSDHDGGDDHGFAIIIVVVIIVVVVMIGCGGLEGEGGDKADSNSARSRPFAGFAFCVDTENCLDFSTFSTSCRDGGQD